MVPSGHLLKSGSHGTKTPPQQLEKLNTVLLPLAFHMLHASSACGPWGALKENSLIGTAVPGWGHQGSEAMYQSGKIAKALAGR